MVELLAPAGNMECLHAAVSAGADAVYLGLDEFNARRNAGNFTVESLHEACDYAHLRGVAVYVTMNVEILPGELERAVAYARDAWLAGADAFIVQDIGLAAELRRTLPEADLHVSTQMNIHNNAGIAAAAQIGAKRVTLARELSLAEIAELSRLAGELGMEIECFAHGALCICYSGQCLMSSMIGGRSANRGLCAQACRLPYELHREGRDGALPADGEHLLSPRDLCTIDLLGELRDAGVASLKIEGRMKSADYVHEVISVYREALDAPDAIEGDSPAASSPEDRLASRGAAAQWRERLEEAFSRGFTTAYLEGRRGNEIMSYGRPNNRGVFIGRVGRVSDGAVELAPEVDLHSGDIVEFWTNKGHFAASVPDSVGSGKTARIPVEQRVGKGDRVFRVRNAATAFTDDAFEPRVPVSGFAELRVGEAAHIVFRTASGMSGEAWGDVVEPARTKPLLEGDVLAHVDRLGQTPFVLSGLDVELNGHAGMGFSQLHRLRADALDDLADGLLATWRDRTGGTSVAPTALLPYPEDMSGSGRFDETHIGETGGPGRHDRERHGNLGESGRFEGTRRDERGRAASCEVAAWATNPGCARAAKRAGAVVYVPLLNFRRGQAQECGVRQEEIAQAGYPKQCIMALPAIEHEPVPGTREERLAFEPWDYVHPDKRVFADSLAGALRALELGAHVEIGPHVPLTNKAALRFAAELGVKRVWLSPELTLAQIADIADDSPVDLGLFVGGAQELMICEHCLLMSQGPCDENCETCPRRSVAHRLVDRKGFEFPVVTDLLGRSHLYNGIELDASSALPDLVDLGITAVMVDTTLMNAKTAEAAVGRFARGVEAAMDGGRGMGKRPGTTTGHLFRGVQ